MTAVSKNQSHLDDESAKILAQAADVLIKHTTDLLGELKRNLANIKNQKKPMSSVACRDFLFTIISHPVIFCNNEAKENLGFMGEKLIDQILGDREAEFDPNSNWSEEDNTAICHLVLKIASRHFKAEYIYSENAKSNVRFALYSAVKEWIDDVD